MRIVDDGKDAVYFKCMGSVIFTNIIMQRDIRGGEWNTYFSENSFRFNAVYLHQDKERTVAVPLNLRDLDLEETMRGYVFSHQSKLDLTTSDDWPFSM